MSVSSNEDFTFTGGFAVTGWGNDYAGNVRRAKDKCERQPRTHEAREHLKAPLHQHRHNDGVEEDNDSNERYCGRQGTGVSEACEVQRGDVGEDDRCSNSVDDQGAMESGGGDPESHGSRAQCPPQDCVGCDYHAVPKSQVAHADSLRNVAPYRSARCS